MITEVSLLKDNRIKFRKWLDDTSRGNKPEYKNHLADVLEYWLDERLRGISIGNLFRFESKDVSEFLQVAKKIYEHPLYNGKKGIDWKDRHKAPSAAISNYYRYLGFEGNWKKDIYATDPFGIKKDYIEKKFAKASPQKDDEFMPESLIQIIFFGAPGTGKSHKIDYDLFKDENGNPIGKGIKEIPENRKFRTTFHPDYDYAQFVGAYKPRVDEKSPDKKIIYSFVPQVFAKAYAKAWELFIGEGGKSTSENQIYLVIEEINRGNCAQIFGDIFQLLDRDSDGFSQYSIDADCDFAEWLEKEFLAENVWDAYKEKVDGEGKLKLPPNLNILATMNTSDQSLFPMDSAFKRRFDWEYVPIRYAKDDSCGDSWNADLFKVVIDKDTSFSWLHFLKKVNADIYKATESEDKQMGEFFIKPKNGSNEIGLDEFRSKVLFYLWDSVYKDDPSFKNVFHFEKDGSVVTFQRLFAGDFTGILKQILKNLDEAYKDGEFKDLKILEG